MARTLYAGRPGDTVASLFNIGERYVYALPADANGDPTAVVLTVWNTPGGTQYTDLLAADGVTPITQVVVPSGTIQIPAFFGPDGIATELWFKDPEGDYTRLDLGPAGPPGPGDVDGPASAVANRFATFNGTTGKVIKDSGLSLDTDTSLAANSDTRIPSQKAVKAYADAIVAAQDAMVFKGVIDCSTNPNYPAADRGHTYRVSVAGKIGGASGTNVEAGDLLVCLTDGTAAGTQAAVGSSWTIAQTNIDGAVIGPASATSGRLASFNGTSGKAIQDSGVAIGTAAGDLAVLSTGGRFAVARLGSGTPDGTKYLRDDGVFATPAGGGSSGGLLAYLAYNPASAAVPTTTSTTAVDIDATNLVVTFTAPTSGKVYVNASLLCQLSSVASTRGQLCLRDASTTVAGSHQTVIYETVAINAPMTRVNYGAVITGLTSGTSYTWKLGWLVNGAVTMSAVYGGSNAYGPATIAVWSAP